MIQISTNSGIYMLENTINGRKYIGSTSNLKLRIDSHFTRLRRNVHENKKLQNCFNKNGDNFKVVILEECSEEIILEREQYYIDNVKPYYNICRIAGRTSGFVQSKESRLKMSTSKKELYLEGFKVWNKGLSTTEETKKKISESLKGKYVGKNHPFYGKKHTEEARQKCIDASIRRKGTHHTGHKGRVFKLDKNTLEVLDVYSSAPAAAKTLNIKGKVSTAGNKIGEASKCNRSAYGFKWVFEKDLDQVKLDELLETLARKTKAISIQATSTLVEGSETTGEVKTS